MNKQIKNPLIVNILPSTPNPVCAQNGRRIQVPVNVSWAVFTNAVNPLIRDDAYDSVIVHVSNAIPFDQKGMVRNVNYKMNVIAGAATKADKAALNDADKDCWYLMNPSYKDTDVKGYAPSDETVLEKYHSYQDPMAWQKHQADVWKRMADMMPLMDGKREGQPNHVAQLTDKKRGLERQDLKDFWSFQSNAVLSPSLMGDDMIGMPGILGKEYKGFTVIPSGESNEEKPLTVRSLSTIGMSGIAIPMANAEGNVPKYQIATDPSKINVMLKARAKDGVSITKGEYFNKKTNQFKFQFTNGQDSFLHVEDATNEGVVTFADSKGTFTAHMKDQVKDVLIARGYEIPEFIDSLQVVPNAKYIWQSRGTMVGSEAVTKVVSPSNAGFVIGREPKNGATDYVVLVAEGALKGRIVAKYVDVTDSQGKSFGDYIGKNSGIIVAQVPGVSKAFVESVKPIYDAYPVKGTYIAMDADGRDNLAVANGIDTAYHCLKECNPVRVMSWNPDQKGLDDALLAVAQRKITLADMDLKFGTPEKLFPKEAAKAPNPYKLDGTRVNREEWKVNYAEDSKIANEKIKALQRETQLRAAANLKGKVSENVGKIQDGGENLEQNLIDLSESDKDIIKK